MAAGSSGARVCSYALYPRGPLQLQTPQLTCPVCAPWPAIVKIRRVGEKLPSARTATKELGGSRSVESRENSERLGTRSLSRGAARAILDAAGSFAQRLWSGQWRSPAFQLYLDLGEGSQAMAPISIPVSGDDS